MSDKVTGALLQELAIQLNAEATLLETNTSCEYVEGKDALNRPSRTYTNLANLRQIISRLHELSGIFMKTGS